MENASRKRIPPPQPHPRASQGDVGEHGRLAHRTRADQDHPAQGQGLAPRGRETRHARQARRSARPAVRQRRSSSRTSTSPSSSMCSAPAMPSGRAAMCACSRRAFAMATWRRWRSSNSLTETRAPRVPRTARASRPKRPPRTEDGTRARSLHAPARPGGGFCLSGGAFLQWGARPRISGRTITR